MNLEGKFFCLIAKKIYKVRIERDGGLRTKI